MAFEYIKVPGLNFSLPATTSSDGRYYLTPEGKRYPSASSITKILSREAIEAWRKRVGAVEADRKTKRGGDRGTAVHLLAEQYLQGTLSQETRLAAMPTILELFLQLKQRYDTFITGIHCIEQALYSDRLRIAGRTDGIVIWDGVLAVLDHKTSGYAKPEAWITNYFVQATAYAEMYEERTGIPVQKLVIAMAVEDSLHPTIYVKDKAEYLPILHNCIAQFYREQESQ